MSLMRCAALNIALQRCIDLAQDHMRAGNEPGAKIETEFVSELALALSEDCHNKTKALMDIRDIVRDAASAIEKLEQIQDVIESLTPSI